MKNKAFLIFLILFVIISKLYSQLYVVNDLLIVKEIPLIIDSVFNSHLSNDSCTYFICNRFIDLNPNYFSKMALNNEDSITYDWKLVLENHKGELIDSSMSDIPDSDNLIGVFFITPPFKNYIIVEFYLTYKYRGYLCSDILNGRRLKLLLKKEGENLILVNYRIKDRTNVCKFLD